MISETTYIGPHNRTFLLFLLWHLTYLSIPVYSCIAMPSILLLSIFYFPTIGAINAYLNKLCYVHLHSVCLNAWLLDCLIATAYYISTFALIFKFALALWLAPRIVSFRVFILSYLERSYYWHCPFTSHVVVFSHILNLCKQVNLKWQLCTDTC